MPTYSFQCQCGEAYRELAKLDEKVKCPTCGVENSAMLPSQGSTVVMETRDVYRGKQVKKDNEKQMRERMKQHHDKYEIADRVDRFGLDGAIKDGLLKRAKKV